MALTTFQACKPVGRLSSAIAHEIRNPVAMICSSLATAVRGGLNHTDREEMFSIAAPDVSRLERHHEQLAEATQVGFSVLTVIFAAILFVSRLLRRASSRMVATVLPLVFLVFYGAGMLRLTNTAHNGGRLVHEYGVRPMVAPSPLPTTAAGDDGD